MVLALLIYCMLRVSLQVICTEFAQDPHYTPYYSGSILFGHEEAGTWVTATGLSPAGRQDRAQTKC